MQWIQTERRNAPNTHTPRRRREKTHTELSISNEKDSTAWEKMRLLQITSNIGLRGLITTSYAATNGIIHTNNFDIFQTAFPTLLQ